MWSRQMAACRDNTVDPEWIRGTSSAGHSRVGIAGEGTMPVLPKKPGLARTLGSYGNLGTCASSGLFVYHSLCCYIHSGARRTPDGGQPAYFLG
jgi:hypothetical protein